MWVVECLSYDDGGPLTNRVIYGPFDSYGSAEWFVGEHEDKYEYVAASSLTPPFVPTEVDGSGYTTHPDRSTIGDYVDPYVVE